MQPIIQAQIAKAYGWENPHFLPVTSGLINATNKVTVGVHTYICQQINTKVFKDPALIDTNLALLADYFSVNAPGYLFTAPVSTLDKKTLVVLESGYYRVFDWINQSHTIDVVDTTAQAFEAAKQFGLFTALLKGFDAKRLGISLPDFHNLSLRYQQFQHALLNGHTARIQTATNAIRFLQSQEGIVKRYQAYIAHPDAQIRVTHHDTKISNVLFNESQKGICVIDLDTVMPGYFLSDVGDMFRTYVCPVSEEETDLQQITIRKTILEAIQQGYLTAMTDSLTSFEMDHFLFGGELLIYMQGLRFLTDFLNNDSYYGSRYPNQNLKRAENQQVLLEAFQAYTS